MERLKILIIIKKFAEKYPKHKHKYDMIEALEEFADIEYWNDEGDICDILKKIRFKPDFILHYDFAWDYTWAPKITGLEKVDIPKGCFVIDIHWIEEDRIRYFEDNKIDLIFSVSRKPFLKVFPQYKNELRWIPFSINPNIIKDWKIDKTIDFLLMGLVYIEDSKYHPKSRTFKGRYKFREAVLNKMKNEKGFEFIPHPGHLTPSSKKPIVNEKYAMKLNQSKIFFTCGGEFEYAVAKFFEAPGCKTLLLAHPNKEILDLGFEDGVNFVACDEDDFYEKAIYYIENDVERERITNNGYEFIHSNHTNSVRAKQFINYIEDYLQTDSKKKIHF
ncbi:glycosyltransferase family protein [Brassicibacter mesophilus]|uniref:glycosyltransferase n=1 Tax=Brassicibacter mesophilus TaxID=745119 RepID=UPI003D23410F